VYLGKANLREPRPACKTIPRNIRVRYFTHDLIPPVTEVAAEIQDENLEITVDNKVAAAGNREKG